VRKKRARALVLFHPPPSLHSDLQIRPKRNSKGGVIDQRFPAFPGKERDPGIRTNFTDYGDVLTHLIARSTQLGVDRERPCNGQVALQALETCFRKVSTHPFGTDRDFANLLYSVLTGAAKNAFEGCVAGKLAQPFPANTGDPKTVVMENVANLLTRARRDATQIAYQMISPVGHMDVILFLALPMATAFPGKSQAELQQVLTGSDKFFAHGPAAQTVLAASYASGGLVGATIELVHQFK
jgi:hypothetical protein